jgi:hypothetical protein
MKEKKLIKIPHFFALTLGLVFYSTIGFLFVSPNVFLRIWIFFLFFFIVKYKLKHYLIIFTSGFIGFLINPTNNNFEILTNILNWSTLTGCILGSLMIYEEIFSGGDFASISKYFKNKNKVAVYLYYIFKIIPLLLDIIERIAKAYFVYGKRIYYSKSKFRIDIAIDIVVSFFIELLLLMFSHFRIIERRENVAFLTTQNKKEVPINILIFQLLISISILFTLILSFAITGMNL